MIMSSELSKIHLVAALLLVAVALFALAGVLVKHPTIHVVSQCDLETETQAYCRYSCYFSLNCNETSINARVLALHFNWDAIYDNQTIIGCNYPYKFGIDLPKREYNYLLRATFYGKRYGTYENTLRC